MACHQGFSAGMGVRLHTHTHTHTHTRTRTHTHTEFVLGLAPLLARWQYGSITNEGHPSCANSLSPLADSEKSSFLPRSYESGELIVSEKSQKCRQSSDATQVALSWPCWPCKTNNCRCIKISKPTFQTSCIWGHLSINSLFFILMCIFTNEENTQSNHLSMLQDFNAMLVHELG